MGITYTEGTLTGPTGKQATVRFLVDSGAVYTLVPHDVWKALELVPKRTVTFTLADGTPVDRPVSECHLTLPQGEATRLSFWASPATKRSWVWLRSKSLA